MTFLGLLLVTASLTGAHCNYLPAEGDHDWLSGTYQAKPVVSGLQKQMIALLGSQSFIPVELSLAKSASGAADLPSEGYYYLAKAAFIGGTGEPEEMPQGTSLSVDVDSLGTAYVTTYRLTSETRTTEFATVIISQTPIKQVTPLCGAAE